jgi:hypothetical protein
MKLQLKISSYRIPLLYGFLLIQLLDINLLIKGLSTHGKHTGNGSGFSI